MDEPMQLSALNAIAISLMRLHAEVDYVIELLEEENGEEEDRP